MSDILLYALIALHAERCRRRHRKRKGRVICVSLRNGGSITFFRGAEEASFGNEATTLGGAEK